MPTRQELDDLRNRCRWTWTTRNGINGYSVRGRGKYAPYSIFLPAAGYGKGSTLIDKDSHGRYWSSVPYEYSNNKSWFLHFSSGGPEVDNDYRHYGLPIRPVKESTR